MIGASQILINYFGALRQHEIVVTDEHGCTMMIDFEISQPDAIQIIPTVTNPLCHNEANGQIDIDIVGGTGSYQFNADFVDRPKFACGNIYGHSN